jgi:urease accessory protein
MEGAAAQFQQPSLQRAFGEISVSVKGHNGYSALDGLRQAGCLKARFPRRDDVAWLNIVTLNTSGGVAGGDELQGSFVIHSGAGATIASQAAERFYRALPGGDPSRVYNRISVAAGGAAEWLPQETILFNRCSVRRRLRIELAADARFLGVESLVFGRTAMGEVVERASVHDLIEVRRDGRLLLYDAIRLDGAVADMLTRKAIADGARAVATLVLLAPDAEDVLEAVRAASPWCGASAWDGMLIARLVASDGASMRAAVVDILHVLRGGRPLPRVWRC